MTRVDEVRAQLQRLVRAAPFRPFIIKLENGEQVPVEHPENIAFSPAPLPSGKVRQAFFVITDEGLVRSVGASGPEHPGRFDVAALARRGRGLAGGGGGSARGRVLLRSGS